MQFGKKKKKTKNKTTKKTLPDFPRYGSQERENSEIYFLFKFRGVLLGVWWLGCCQDCVEQVSAWCPVGFWMPPFSLKDFPGEVTCQGARF